MKDAYRKLLILIIVMLTSFLVIAGFRKVTGQLGLLDFLKGTAGKLQHAPERATLAKNPPLSVGKIPLLQQINAEYTKLAAAVMPSVVSINTAGVQGKQVIDRFGRPQLTTSRVMGQGSGVIVSYEGHVITNYHVIANKQQIQVTASDNKVYPADLIGTDPALDIAVLKIRGNGKFIPLKFGDSDAVREGNKVLAFGNPFDIGKSVTNGMISARERSLSDQQGGLLQSSAAVNPGYSGGPLVNVRGEVIGINSSIYSTDEKHPGFQGISFSIPSNIVLRTFEDICKRGRPVRGFLGVSMEDLNDYRRKELGLPFKYGALVQRVGEDTPASRAGIESGDIILEWDGNKVRDFSHLIGMIQRSKIDELFDTLIWRKGQTLTLDVKIAEFDSNLAQIPNSPESIKNQREILKAVGIEVTHLSVTEWRQGYNGVKVRRLIKGSSAEGLVNVGDIISQINEQVIHQPDQFYRYLLMHSVKEQLELHVIRDGEEETLKVSLPPLNEK